jgi:hypothetical protein
MSILLRRLSVVVCNRAAIEEMTVCNCNRMCRSCLKFTWSIGEDRRSISINEEFDEIYEIVMPNFPFFSGINYEPWATEMKKLLWLVDLLHYDHEGRINFYDKRRGVIALQLIISALDENILSSILGEFGEVYSAKIFWDILEMKYSMKWSEKDEVDEDIVVENDDCVEIFVTEIETENGSIEIAMIDDESVSVADNKAACDNEEMPMMQYVVI